MNTSSKTSALHSDDHHKQEHLHKNKQWNMSVYGLFVAIGIYSWFVTHNYTQTSIFLGLALAFDPFNDSIPWEQRPTYQKGWLVLHATCVAGLFGYSLGK